MAIDRKAPTRFLPWPLLAVSLTLACSAPCGADDSVLEITASAETFAFSPAKIVAHVGQRETIQLTSSEGTHGISSPELGIGTTLIRPRHPATVTFTPTKPGEYVVHCAYVCGTGHAGMAFTVDVQP
jgi:heme/copper-type cytochrome/quinol oxidase subunit 2